MNLYEIFVKVKPTTKLLSLISLPWKKYSEFFDNGCWGIWGLSSLLKYTILYFALIFVSPILGWFRLYEDYSTTDIFLIIYALGLVALAVFWLIYLPILCLILVSRFLKNARLLFKESLNSISDKKRGLKVLGLNLRRVYNFFMVHLVQFYPFSYLYKDRLFHPSNKELKRFIIRLEKIAKRVKVPILIYGSEFEYPFYQFNAELQKPVRGGGLKSLETSLQEKLGTIYVRPVGKNQLRIIMPTDMLATHKI